jgi:Starter unit:ACP transacylase in aflatoxin biosynthesis
LLQGAVKSPGTKSHLILTCVIDILKMCHIAVFAGLGSESLFSRTTLDTAIQDALMPESQIILCACYAVFRTQVTRAIEQGRLAAEAIDLDDFAQPETLLQPPTSYHDNVIIQHTTIYLVQIFRYLRHCPEVSDLQGVTGFCAGLLPGAAVATAHNVIEFLQRAQDFFHVALWLGINSETYRRSQISLSGCSPSLPWSVVVDNVSVDIITSLIDADAGSVRDRYFYSIASVSNQPPLLDFLLFF